MINLNDVIKHISNESQIICDGFNHDHDGRIDINPVVTGLNIKPHKFVMGLNA